MDFLLDIDETKKEAKTLEEINQILSVSLGLTWKEKVKAFYRVEADQLRTLLIEGTLERLGIKLNRFKADYCEVKLEDQESLYYLKNNIFEPNSNEITVSEFLNQKLIYLNRNHNEAPDFLNSHTRNLILKRLNQTDYDVIRKNYNRQELNSDKFLLEESREDREKIVEILNKVNYNYITVRDYIKIMSSGNYNLDSMNTNYDVILLQDTFEKYLFEICAYLSKKITTYLNEQ